MIKKNVKVQQRNTIIFLKVQNIKYVYAYFMYVIVILFNVYKSKSIKNTVRDDFQLIVYI